jgi:hypothetical protein
MKENDTGSTALFSNPSRPKAQFDTSTYESLLKTIFKNRRLRIESENDP